MTDRIRFFQFFFISLFFSLSTWTVSAARVDNISVYSESMDKSIQVKVIVPDKLKNYPVVYLLHGYSGDAGSWLDIKPELLNYADKEGLIFVCPDGENSWYWDSQLIKKSQFETFVSKELVKHIDTQYKTFADRKFRAITGLSMGGHGAIWLAFRNPEVFGSVGSMSGGLDIRPFPSNWDMEKQIGSKSENPDAWENHTAINQIGKIKNGSLNIIICCGYDDFFFDVNNTFHQKLLQNNIMHDYIVRPGGHTSEYWNNAIDTQLLYFKKVFNNHKSFLLNPVIQGDVADPSIIRIENTYYATGTSSEWAPHYPVFSSEDLVNWKQEGHIFNKKPSWTSNSFWAPELYYNNNTVFCYYTARRKSDGVSYIGVATSDSPTKEFIDHGPIILHGKESIDAFVFKDNDQLYVSWKAYGLENRPIELLASKLSADGLRLEGETFTILKDDERIGMEGQSHFKYNDYYYLIYSTRGCCGFESDYEVHVARSKKFEGPYEKYKSNPILVGGKKDFISLGHGTMVTTPDKRMFYLCHAYVNGDGKFGGRQPILKELIVDKNGWIAFADGKVGRIESALPSKDIIQYSVSNFEDSFDAKNLKVDWTWNYPYAEVETKIDKGNLSLTGKPVNDQYNGSALCLRPKTPNYEYETQVTNRNNSIKGLTFYGDNGNFVVWGVQKNTLLLKRFIDKKEIILFSETINMNEPYLKIEVTEGNKLKFYFSEDGTNWTKAHDSSEDSTNLSRWDRVARPGLFHSGKYKDPAAFSYFGLKNKF